MLPYQERIVAERDELSTKLDLLRAFFKSPNIASVSTYEHNLLKRQERAMADYLEVLRMRVRIFNNTI